MNKLICSLCVVFVFAALLIVPANADHCATPIKYGHYKQKINYGHHDYNYVDKVIAVGIPIHYGYDDYYYSVGDEIREDRLAKMVADKLALQLKAVKPEEKKTVEQKVKQIDFSLISGNIQGYQAQPQKLKQNHDLAVSQIFENSCTKCHSNGSNRPGGVLLLDGNGNIPSYQDSNEEFDNKLAIYQAVRDGSMPKNGKPLAPQQIQTIKEWLKQ